MIHAVTQDQRHGGQAPVVATRLGRVPRVHTDNAHPGTFRLVVEYREELSPARVERGLRQSGTGDAPNIQRLVGNRAVARDEREGRLVVPVAPLVADVLVQLRHARAPGGGACSPSGTGTRGAAPA